MSSYIYFYTRKGMDFHPIGTFCRSTVIYEVGKNNGAPYEKVRALDIHSLNEIISDIEKIISRYKEGITETEDQIKFIRDSNSSLEEKTSYWYELKESCKEYQELIEESQEAKWFYENLISIVNSVRYSDEEYDWEKYVYFGIETPTPIEEGDIAHD